MPAKKTASSKVLIHAKSGKVIEAAKAGFFTFHGIKIASPGKPKSKAAKVIGKELHKRSESRGERKSV